MNHLFIDFETRSEANLKKIGAYQYSKHPSTEVICLAYKYNSEKTKLWVPSRGAMPEGLKFHLFNPYITFIAHNANFETVIINNVLSRPRYGVTSVYISSYSFICTAAKAAAVAIPRSLEGAGSVMKLPIQKDMDGNRLMKKYMKPTLKWSKWSKERRHGLEPKKWYDDELELEAIYDYCIRDVDAEYLLNKSLPDLSEYERGVWLTNQSMNWRGVQVDIKTVSKVIDMITLETKNLQLEAFKISSGVITSILQRDVVLKYLRFLGLNIPNLQAGVVTEFLNRKIIEIDPIARRLLEIRQQVSRTSNKKYFAYLDRVGSDGRVRDISLYHGASTGRESGVGVQLQNMPKGKIKNTDFVIEEIIPEGLDFIKLCYGDPFEVFSSCARGMVTATPGYKIYSADYNAIECRVLNWIADNKSMLNDFKNNIDPYVKMASRLFNVSLLDVTPQQRFIGKICVLALGYQMGPDKFFKTCQNWGASDVTEQFAKKAVKIFRDNNTPIVKLWAATELAAIKAVQNKGPEYVAGKVSYFYSDGFLKCRLPSGRLLSYHEPTVRNEPTPWGDMRAKLYFYYVDSLTKKWVNGTTYGGSLVENNCQAIARDITVNGIMNVKKSGYDYMMNIHDEIVCESKNGDVEKFTKLVTDLPEWADGLPVRAGAWAGLRYRK